MLELRVAGGERKRASDSVCVFSQEDIKKVP